MRFFRRLLRFVFALTAMVFCLAGLSSLAADEAPVVRLAFVNPHSSERPPSGTNAFWDRLRQLGYIEGRNLSVEARWADNKTERLPALIADVVARKPDVLVTWGAPAAVAAKRATTTIPIIALGVTPDASGLTSLAQPGGNLTGLSMGWLNISDKWLELLNEAVPQLSTLAVIANPGNPLNRSLLKQLDVAAKTRSVKLRIIEVTEPKGLDRAFEGAQHGAQAVLVLPDSTLNSDASRLGMLAAKSRLPSMFSGAVIVREGGLMAYGPDFAAQWRRAAEYVDKIMKGAKPTELPIEEPTKFQLTVNLRAAKSLKVTIPESVLVRAEEIIR
jgi:putative ABC transport system substrate-binding protein